MKNIKIVGILLIGIILVGCGMSEVQKTNDGSVIEKGEVEMTPTATPTDIPTISPTETSTPVPLPNIVETEVPKDDTYIIPDSDSRILSVDEVNALDANTKQMAINEIYARYGRKFDTPEIQEYFDSKSWYSGTIAPADFDENVFNKYERCNISSLSGQAWTSSTTEATSPIYFAGTYRCQMGGGSPNYKELHINVGSDPGLKSGVIGDCVANMDYYKTEYFPDGVNSETDYDYGLVYMEGTNIYTIYFDSGNVCTMSVDENGVNISGGDAEGYYSLIEHYYS